MKYAVPYFVERENSPLRVCTGIVNSPAKDPKSLVVKVLLAMSFLLASLKVIVYCCPEERDKESVVAIQAIPLKYTVCPGRYILRSVIICNFC